MPPASWTVRAMSRRLDNQAWTHHEQTNPDASQHPAAWTSPRHVPKARQPGVNSSRADKSRSQPTPCHMDSPRHVSKARQPGMDSSRADKSRNQPTPCLMDSPRHASKAQQPSVDSSRAEKNSMAAVPRRSTHFWLGRAYNPPHFIFFLFYNSQ